jgi:hypothetical protein
MMRLERASTQELIDQFIRIGEEQYQAIWVIDNARYNRLYSEMKALKEELKRRPGDQRRELAKLYDHQNLQVRLMAAHATLAISYAAARQVIQGVADSGSLPYSADAGMTLLNLDRGIYKPT